MKLALAANLQMNVIESPVQIILTHIHIDFPGNLIAGNNSADKNCDSIVDNSVFN